MGVPQGGVICPLLSNLFLHELDQYMEEIMKELEINNSGKKAHLKSTKYNNVTMKIDRIKKKILRFKERGLNTRIEIRNYLNLIKERRRLNSMIPNPEVMRIKYVRYADD